MAKILLIIFGLVSIWDGFTTFYGTSEILGEEGARIAMSGFFALIILGFMVGTSFIWELDGPLGLILKLCWFISVGFDLYTSYNANLEFIMNDVANGEQQVVLLGITILVCASPVIASLIWNKYHD